MVGEGGLVDGVVLLCPLRRVGAEDDILLLGWGFSDGRARELRGGIW